MDRPGHRVLGGQPSPAAGRLVRRTEGPRVRARGRAALRRPMPAERLVLRPPDRGHKILIAEGGLRVPDDPIIPLIEGDGIGPEVVHAAQGAIDAAVENTFGGRRRIGWYPVPAGEKAMFRYGEMLPEATLADSGIGVKPVSETGSKRLVRKAIRYAIENGRKSVTLVHKGNIMKYTEGAFRTWGYEVARDEFRDSTISWDAIVKDHRGEAPDGKVVIKDVIADNMFQQLLLRPEEYDVLATTNLNGDYLSDAAAAQIGGLGVAPRGNIRDAHAVFEPVHGSAPRYAGMNKVNPTAEMLAGVMMLEYLGWRDAGARLRDAVKSVVGSKTLTYDLARQLPGAKEVRTSAFAKAVIEAVNGARR